MKPLRVLVVGSPAGDTTSMIRAMDMAGFEKQVESVGSAESMRAAMRTSSWDIVVCDDGLPGFSAAAVLELVRELGDTTPVLIIGGAIGGEEAAELMAAGAADVLLQDAIGPRLAFKVRRELAASDARRRAARSEQRLRDLVEISADSMWETDRDQRFTFFSDLEPRAVNFRLQDVLGRTPWEIAGIDPNHDEIWARHLEDLAARRPFRGFRISMPTVSGKRVRLSVSGKPVFDESGQFTGYHGTSTSETALLEARDRAERAEALLRDAVDSMSEGLVIYDHEDRLVMCNESYRRTSGACADDLVPGRCFADVLRDGVARGQYPDAIGGGDESLAERMRRHRVLEGAVEERLSDGRWSLVTERRMRNGWTAGLRIDITAQKAAEQALRDSEQMARQIVDTALDAFVQIDERGAIEEWNPQAAALFGWSREEVLGRPFEAVVKPRGRPAQQPGWLAELRRAGDPAKPGTRVQLDAVRRDGREIKLELAATALRRRDGCVLNAFIRDMTEQIASEERLRQTQKMEAIGQLTGGVAHDFNNILTVIIGTMQLLADAVDHDANLAAIVRMIDEAAERGAELTRHLLAFARRQPLHPRRTDVNALIVDTVNLLRPTLGENIAISSALDDAVWPAMVDPSQLATALLNLAVNSRDAMPNGGELTIETRNVVVAQSHVEPWRDAAAGTYVRIAISDTGTGIPAAIRDKVFDPFFTTKPPGKGTGLGLSMVYGFVKQSGGHIDIDSQEGRGTSITILLPRAGERREAPAQAVPIVPLATGRQTILVVEDDDMVRGNVDAQLQSLGYSTVVAASADEALAFIDLGVAVDLLFTDVVMRGAMNGLQLADEIVKRRPSLNVLFTSGYSEDVIVDEGGLDPDVQLLAKPYRRADLANRIRIALARAPMS